MGAPTTPETPHTNANVGAGRPHLCLPPRCLILGGHCVGETPVPCCGFFDTLFPLSDSQTSLNLAASSPCQSPHMLNHIKSLNAHL